MVFSADHMNDPARIMSMCEEGVLSEGRRDALLNFPWHHDVIFHEAGIPPIHTPMRTLEVLMLCACGCVVFVCCACVDMRVFVSINS